MMLGKILRFLAPIFILTASVAIGYALMRTGPVPERTSSLGVAPAVETIRVQSTAFTPIVEGNGIVVPAQKMVVFAEVSGRLTQVHESLVPGGLIDEGEVLVHINEEEYEFILAEFEANVTQAQLELTVERGRRSVATREWDRLESELEDTDDGRHLALRTPHITHAERRLIAAEKRVERAQLNIDRTEITTSFNSLVQSEDVELDLLVSQQTPLATLVGTDEFWVQASVPVDRLAWIPFPDGDGGPVTRVTLPTGTGTTVTRKARLVRLLGEVEPRGRMARVLIEVEDPLLLQGEDTILEEEIPEEEASEEEAPEDEIPEDEIPVEEEDEEEEEEEEEVEAPPFVQPRFAKLLLGAYVSVAIEGTPLENVYRLDRVALRDDNTVWIATAENTLEIRKVNVIWKTLDEVIVDRGLSDEDRVIVSRLSAPIPSMELTVLGEEIALPEPEEDPQNPPAQDDANQEDDPAEPNESDFPSPDEEESR